MLQYLSSLNSLWREVTRAHFWIFVVSHFSTSPTLWSHWLVIAAFKMTWISWRGYRRWMNSRWWLQETIQPKWEIYMNILSTSCQSVLYLYAINEVKLNLGRVNLSPHLCMWPVGWLLGACSMPRGLHTFCVTFQPIFADHLRSKQISADLWLLTGIL